MSFDNKCDKLEWRKKKLFSLRRSISIINRLYKWNATLGYLNLTNRITALEILVEISDVEDELDNKVEMENYNLVFCYFDAEPFQNFMIQYARRHGCVTATLQHGIMLAARKNAEDNPDFAGIEFKSFVSNFFLIWNDFTKNEALKSGINKDQIKVLGPLKCLDVPRPTFNVQAKTIGVILDGEFEKDNNIPLISITQNWAKLNGWKCLFRYHPHFKGTEYQRDIDNNISAVCKKEDPLYQFIAQISFCVVANSTVLFELEYFGIPTIRYSCNNIYDKFRDYDSPSFTNVLELSDSYAAIKECVYENKIDIKTNYKNFFKEYL